MGNKKRGRSPVLYYCVPAITSCQRPEQPEQLQQAWQHQPEQQPERLQRAWRLQPGRQPEPGQRPEPEQPEQLQEPGLCHKQSGQQQAEQQRGETYSWKYPYRQEAVKAKI